MIVNVYFYFAKCPKSQCATKLTNIKFIIFKQHRPKNLYLQQMFTMAQFIC